MSIIIRLQNLPWDASTLNIRQFFHSLSIPDGGVHIIGGEKGDAFIAFSTDEDARQAMKNDGGYIGKTQIKLYLSSKTEMQNVIALAREAAQMHQEPPSRPPPFTQFNERQPDSRSRDSDPATEANMKLQRMSESSFSSQPNEYDMGLRNNARPPVSRPFDNFDAKKPFYEQNPQALSSGGSMEMMGPASAYGGMQKSHQYKPSMDVMEMKKDSRELFQRDFVNKPNNWSSGHSGDFRGEELPYRGKRSFDSGFNSRNDDRMQDNFNSFAPDMTMKLLANLQSNSLPEPGFRNNYARGNSNFPIPDLNFRNNFPKGIDHNNSMLPFDNFNVREENVGGFCVVLENIPITYNVRDIKSLLKEFRSALSSLKIDHDNLCRRTGRVYLCLPSPVMVDNVMRLNGKLVHGLRLRVERCSEREYAQVNEDRKRIRSRSRSRSPTKKTPDGNYMVIKNLSLSAIFKLIGDAKVAKDGGPYAEVGPSGHDKGHVLVEMESKADLLHILNQFRSIIDGNVVLVFQITQTEFDKRVKHSRLLTPENTQGPINPSHVCARIIGLSWNSLEKDIRRFFGDCKIRPNHVHLLLEADGNHSGTAFIEFETPEDCHKGMKRNKEYLDGRYLVITALSRQDMLSQIDRCLQQGKSFKNNSVEHIKGFTMRKPVPEETIVYMKNLSFRTQLEDILEFFEGFQVLPDSVHLQYKDDIPTGDGMIKFDSRVEARRAISKLDKREMLGRTVHLMF